MKIILKNSDEYSIVLRAKFDKGRIIGELYLFELFKLEIPTGEDFHIHFIYFENGDYHFSIKYFDTSENLYVDRKSYYNHICTYKSPYKDFKFRSIERRDRIIGVTLDMFMMSEKMKPWNELPIGHKFGTFYFHSNNLNNLIWEKNINIKTDDIVIDLEEHPNKAMNFSPVVYSNENKKMFESSNIQLNNLVHMESITQRNDLFLKIYALIFDAIDE